MLFVLDVTLTLWKSCVNFVGVRCPHHGMDCCDYDEDEYFYSDEEYYTDEESEDEFLDSIAQR